MAVLLAGCQGQGGLAPVDETNDLATFVGDLGVPSSTPVNALVSAPGPAITPNFVDQPPSGFSSSQRWTGAWGSDGPIFTGDLNGDGKSDVFMWRDADKTWSVNLANASGTNFSAATWTGDWGSDGPINTGDLNGDGKTDVFMWRNADRVWTVNISTGTGFAAAIWTGAWGSDGPIRTGDLNGDGKTDVFMWRDADKTWSVNLSNGSGFNGFTWTGAWGSDGPIYTGDVNGDGKTDVFMWRKVDNTWSVNLSSGTGFIARQYLGACGRDGTLVQGDFNGDGKSDVMMWRDGFKQWMTNLSVASAQDAFANTGFNRQEWNGNWGSDGPILTGDLDHNGATDVFMWRDADKSWMVNLSARSSTPLFTAITRSCGTPAWSNPGPSRVDESTVNSIRWAGKVDEIQISPNFDGFGTPAMYLVTAASCGWGSCDGRSGGGVWRSTDFTLANPTWVPLIDHIPGLTDAQRIGILNIGSIAVSGANPQTIVAAANTPTPELLKSTNGGNGWSVIGQGQIGSAGQSTNRVAVDPAGIIYVASNVGFFVSEDGGASFTNVAASNVQNLNFFDVAWYSFGNPATVFVAGMDGVQNASSQTGIYTVAKINGAWTFTSTGVTQTDLVGQPFNLWTASGIRLRAEPGNPASAAVAATMTRNSGGLINVFKVQNNGNGTFTWIPQWFTTERYGTGGNYVLPVGIQPDGRVYGGGIGLGVSNGSGGQLNIQSGPGVSGPSLHVDIHTVAYSRFDGKVYVGTDGGIARYLPNPNPTVTWQSVSTDTLVNQLSVGLDYNPVSWNNLVVGHQDNGLAQGDYTTWRRPSGGSINEGELIWFDPLDPAGRTVYAWELSNKVLLKSTDGGISFPTSPLPMADPQGNNVILAFHPTQRNRFLAATGRGNGCTVFETFDGWSTAANTIDLNPPLASCPTALAYVGGDKYIATSGGVLLQQVAGSNAWTNVWPASNPQSPIVSILADSANASSLYLGTQSITGQVFFKKDQTDGLGWGVGSGVLELTGSGPLALPFQVTQLALLPSYGRPPALYAATIGGIFQAARPNGVNTNWVHLGTGFPDAWITDLRVNPSGHGVYLATYGRGAWSLTDYGDATELIANGGLETGTFAGWGAGGVASTITSSHSGNYAAQLGAPGTPSGDNVLTQIIAIPPDATTLSFSYWMICPDTIAYDWTTATLTDNTTHAVTTIMNKVCQSNSGWVNFSTSVTAFAGRSVTLSIISHDDQFPSDPSYTWVDDISVF